MDGCERGRVGEAVPGVEVRGRVDRAVVLEVQERTRVDLEVEVRERRERIARVADEADHLASPYAALPQSERAVAGEVGVVELVAGAIADPEPPAAELLPADTVQRPGGHGDDRRSERGEDVVAVVPAAGNVAARRAVGVAERDGARDREVVWAAVERRRQDRKLMAALLLDVLLVRPRVRGGARELAELRGAHRTGCERGCGRRCGLQLRASRR